MPRGNVRVSIESQFNDRGVRQAEASIGKLGRTGAKLGAGLGLGFVGATTAVDGLTAAVGGSLTAFGSFQKRMNEVKAVSGANAAQMRELSKAARQIGTDTGLGASQAAQAIAELAKGGLSADKIIRGGLAGAIDLARAGSLDLADAASTTANALNLFKLGGEQATHVADALAQAANATTADVADFAVALSQGGGAAKAAGLSFDQTVVALEALAAASVKNSDAGTSLKNAMIKLAAPSKQAKAVMDELNLSFFDQTGKIKSLADISEMLRGKLKGYNEQARLQILTTIAGTDGFRGLLALYDAGPKKIERWRKSLEQQGTASDIANQKQKGLDGSIQKLRAAFENLGITLGAKAAPKLTKFINHLTTFVKQAADGEGAGGRFRDRIEQIVKSVKDALAPWADLVKKVGEFLGHEPGLTRMIGTIATLAATVKAIKFAGAITGLSAFVKAGQKASGQLRTALVQGGEQAGAAAATATATSYAGKAPGKFSAKLPALAGKLGPKGKILGAAIGAAMAAEILAKLQDKDFLKSLDDIFNTIMPFQPRSSNGGLKPYKPPPGAPPYQRDNGPLRLENPTGAGVRFGRGRNPLYLDALGKATAPTRGRGTLIGFPNQGTHTLGNWQSDNAIDIKVKRGTPVVALEDGKVRKVVIRKDGGGRFAGSQVTIDGASGNAYFYAHLSRVDVRTGQTVAAGEVIGASGSANGVAHLHFGVEKGDPRSVRITGGGGGGAGGRMGFSLSGKKKLTHRQKIIQQAARKYGIDPAILWGLYGAESNFGKNTGPSPAGAVGPFQFMPGTARKYGIDPKNFRQAAFAAAKYLSTYSGRGLEGMLAAYNAGPNGNPNNRETIRYIAKVQRLAKKFPSTNDVEFMSPSEIKAISEIIAKGLIRPIARRLRKDLKPLVAGIGRVDRDLGRFDAAGQIASAGGDLFGERDALLGKGFAEGTKKRLLEQAARKYSRAVKRLKAKLTSAPSMQKGVIRAQISKYQDRIRELRDEARALGIQIQIDAEDLKEVMEEIHNIPKTDWSPLRDRFQGILDARLIAAQLTPGTDDDLAVLGQMKSWFQKNYDAAVASGDIEGQIDWGGKLKDVIDAIDGLTSSTEEQNALLQQQLDLEKQKSEDLRKALATSQSQYGVFKQWLGDVVSGQVGGRAGLGFQSVGYAGGGARY